jgi:hypothetical protein
MNIHYDEFVHFETISFPRTMEGNDIHETEVMNRIDMLQSEHTKNKFSMVKLKEDKELINYEIQIEPKLALVEKNGVYLVLYCPECSKEMYRVRL